MNNTNPVELQPQRQRPEPLDGLGVIGSTLEYFEEGLMLHAVLFVVNAQVAVVIVRVQRVIGDSIELVIAHDR